MDTLQRFIKQTIETKTPVTIQYKGKQRNVLPFMLGRTKDDRLVLQGFQRGEGGGWRYFYLSEVANIVTDAVSTPNAWEEVGEIKKSEDGSYKPPAFVTEVLALVNLPAAETR